jgi:hypothetical protein
MKLIFFPCFRYLFIKSYDLWEFFNDFLWFFLGGATSVEKPYFDDINPRNLTTVVDDTAILKCTVRHKGDRTVSTFLLDFCYLCENHEPSRPIHDFRPSIWHDETIIYQTARHHLCLVYFSINIMLLTTVFSKGLSMKFNLHTDIDIPNREKNSQRKYH